MYSTVMQQISFEDATYLNRSRKTRKQKFLEEMDKAMPWKRMVAVIEPHYPKGERGRRPFPLETMLRIHFMQQWFGLSDPGMEDELHDNVSSRVFAGLPVGVAPDETTICKFRHLLEKHKLAEQLFATSQKHLVQRGLMVKSATIVDATIISAPTSTKNKDRQRDPEMKSTRKGNQCYFGMKAHIGTDTEGRVHSVEVTSANVHDSVVMPECLHGGEKVIYADKAYVNKARKKAAEDKGVEWRVLRKATKKRKLNCADTSFNRKSNRTRAKVEHAFGVIKNLWGYRKVRYRGLAKNTGQVYTLLALANIYMARKQLLAC